MIVGAAGKMGPWLAVMAQRAARLAGNNLRIIGVSRFTDPSVRRWLEAKGVETLNCDILNPNEVQRLPDAANVIYLVGVKFGTQTNPALTWAASTLGPAHVATRIPKSR